MFAISFFCGVRMALDCRIILPCIIDDQRLPGKLLRSFGSETVLARTWKKILHQDYLQPSLVATNSQEIADECRRIGAPVHLQQGNCSNGAERVAAASSGMDPQEIVVMVNPDEVNISPVAIEHAVAAVKHGAIVATAAYRSSYEMAKDPNVVKVIIDEGRLARYFSRSLIPFPRESGSHFGHNWLAHIGVFAGTVGTFQNYVGWGACDLEIIEGLEQLRWVYHGIPLFVATLWAHGRSIKTELDLRTLIQGYEQ